MAKCRKCGADASKEDVLLIRVNPLGQDGEFECKPICKVNIDFEDRLNIAVMGDEELE